MFPHIYSPILCLRFQLTLNLFYIYFVFLPVAIKRRFRHRHGSISTGKTGSHSIMWHSFSQLSLYVIVYMANSFIFVCCGTNSASTLLVSLRNKQRN